MRRFDKLIKQVSFDDKATCLRETKRTIDTDSTFNKNDAAVAAIVIDSNEDLKKHIYPRIEYFHKHRSSKLHSIPSSNIFKDDISLFESKSSNIFDTKNKQATYNTIEYVLDQFHKCLFIQILNNKIHTFVVINRYDPEYSKSLAKTVKESLDSNYKDLNEFVNHMQRTRYKNFKIAKLQEDSIYFTDCALHLWSMGDTHTPVYDRIYGYFYHLLEELLQVKKINDCEFIYNSRDLNVLLKDGESSPHYNLLGNFTTKLSKQYKPFIPILNFNRHKRFADLPVPTNDDWEIITNKMFIGECRDLYINVRDKINTDYDSKIPTAIFRGGATGCGTTIKNNQRLKAAYLTSKYYKNPKYGINNSFDSYQYLDARLVSFKIKPKKHYSDKYIRVVDPDKLPIRLSKKMSIGEISNYKYILSIEGNIAQFRLSLELSYNSVILLVKSDQYIWYQPLLKPWIHYVPIKSDLSDLMDKIHWCKTHDDKCKTIARNAFDFYKKYMNRRSVYDYMECVLNV